MEAKTHPFHLVDLSPWPILSAFSLLFLASGGVMVMHHYSFAWPVLILGCMSVLFCMYSWWRDVIKEGVVDGAHTEPVRMGLRIGMALFILSEVMFFFAFFFSFFKFSLFPVGILEGVWIKAEGIWPPAGIETFDPWHLPFMNTLILLLSGTTVTWAHYAILENNQKDAAEALGYTVFLGAFFSIMQAFEYHHASFGFKDGVYAANFYMATGFHGAHVMIGTIFLAVCYFRTIKGHFAAGKGHLGFEFAAWYWHFVDVVWLFLFAFVYVWGR
jgi:cytochrome c oxidase subunit III